MKPTPRRAEREVAAILSEVFTQYGLSPVERIPVLGRTGPDITINEFKLVLDVKSRKSVPQAYFTAVPLHLYEHLLIPLNDLSLVGRIYQDRTRRRSKVVTRWLDHMDEWRQEHCPDGISGLILRCPGMPFGNSVLVIYSHQLEEYKKRWKIALSRKCQGI